MAENKDHAELELLFIVQLRDIYWAEQKQLKMLSEWESASWSTELKQALSSHLQETANHQSRLEKVFGTLNIPIEGKICHAIAGIADEGKAIIDETEDNTAQRDVGLIFAGQKAEHYEIATYGGLVQLARTLGYIEAAENLSVTLAEEKKADSLLTRIAETLDVGGDLKVHSH